MEISQNLLQKPDTKLHGDFKHIPHKSNNTPLSHFVSKTNKPKHHESCSTKSKPYSMLQIKNFRCCVVKAKFRNSFVLPKNNSVILKTAIGICMCAYKCVYEYMCMHMHVCMYVGMYVCMYVCVCSSLCVSVYVCMYVCMCMYIWSMSICM